MRGGRRSGTKLPGVRWRLALADTQIRVTVERSEMEGEVGHG